MENLLETIRRRGLDRVGIGYAVAAWAIIQATALAAGAFAWPNWISQAAIVAGLVGFPVALASAWVFAVHKEQGHVRPTSRGDATILAGIGAICVVIAAALPLGLWPKTGSNVQPNLGTPPAASIAVLPFANLSGDPKKLYFSDGIADQLINTLSQNSALHVAARTSSFASENKKQDVKAIARSLNVRSVVEGSVLGDRDRIRIAVQLVDGQTGFQVWSRSYDRDLSDILVVQDSIAREIAAALGNHLLVRVAKTQDARTINPQSYRLFLQGRFFVARDAEADYRRAADIFKQVTVRAPGYANGFAEYGSALIALASDYGDNAVFPQAEAAARQALSLDSRNLLALRTLMLVSIAKWDWLAAADRFRSARAINPNSYGVLHSQSVLAATMNLPQQDFEAEKRAAELDPLSFVAQYNLGVWYFQQGRYDEAVAAQQKALLLQPANPAGRDALCSNEVARHNLRVAHRMLANLATLYASEPGWRMGCPLDIALAEGRSTDARKIADQAAAAYRASEGGATEIGSAYRRLGALDRAIEWYERAYAARERSLLLVPSDRQAEPTLLADLRWKALWARPPIHDWEVARGEVAKLLGTRA
ncbi:MAG: tetratricopeptide repeat protein [Alphaproteobacteria bacterium]|nr:tetratricopeptide repeat protein [Alphaproteobacteria bacterium]MBV9062027.1 tetratricopeptide repeat protein [Alphaproteobacteria bacterium]